MGSRHKHTRFVNACVKYLQKENAVESTTGFLENIRNYKGERYVNAPSPNELAQLLARDVRFKQVDTDYHESLINNKTNYEITIWGLKCNNIDT